MLVGPTLLALALASAPEPSTAAPPADRAQGAPTQGAPTSNSREKAESAKPARPKDEAPTRISLGDDVLDPAGPRKGDRPSMCWVRPKRLAAKDSERLREAFEGAGLATRPKHVDFPIIEIRDPKVEGPLHHCLALVTVLVRPLARRAQITIETQELGAPAPAVEGEFTARLSELDPQLFTPEWEKIWQFFSPPPPPPPPEPPPAPSNFVDEDLVREQELAKGPVEAARSGPVVSLLLSLGFFSRSVSAAPGVAQEGANAPSVGGDATLHVASVVGLPAPHDLDLRVGYQRRLVTAERGDTDLGVSADRFDVTTAYRHRLGDEDSLPRLGGLVGYELLRFEIDTSADALSARYGVLRAGASIEERVYATDEIEVALGLDPVLRLMPGTRGGQTNIGFDLGGGAKAQLTSGLVARVWVRYAHHRAESFGVSFSDGHLDAEFGLGWSL